MNALTDWSTLRIVCLVLAFVVPAVAWILLFRRIWLFSELYRLGQPDHSRTGSPVSRTVTMLKEFFVHNRMAKLKVVALAHWFVAIGFYVLFSTLANAFFQIEFGADFRLPVIGHFPPFEWLIEFLAFFGVPGIIALIIIRQRNHPRSAAGVDGRKSRFFGSHFLRAYFVEAVVLGVMLCIGLLRMLEAALVTVQHPEESLWLHFPFFGWGASLFSGMSVNQLANTIYVVATVKILISFIWMIVIAMTPQMGVAWHRFLAFPNIWAKRDPRGGTALGDLKPMTMGDGTPFSMEAMEAAAEDEDAAEPVLGVGAVEQFTWKGLLDFSTCTECGRCQSQCPAWNTEKPLSPKLLMMTLRDHSMEKAPYLKALREHDGDTEKALAAVTTATEGVDVAGPVDFSSLSLIGDTGYDIEHPLTAYNPHGPDAVIDADVLWSCTTCGACVEQCPVDIEHVDHIVDMRRYQTLIESAFPQELAGLFKNLEGKGNPWGMGARARLDWAKDLPFDVKILGQDVESASEVDYLFWVGCAGAYEDRAKKTTRAVAELLDTAGVSFAVLGDGETCAGDSARRSGNEMLFQMLAQQNVETMNELGVTKVVVTCAHCFNSIKNEYPDLGGSFEVVHHTQLLNRLVRDKKLVPVARPAGAKSTAKDAASSAETVTYHDPCYLGRHNDVYAPPRELIGSLPGVQLTEMPRNRETSFCCGAGGARMWMEEKLGSRINLNRTDEAIATGAERIAIGCPFCRVMISDGLTARQSEGASESIEVVDIAQMLLAAVRRGDDAAADVASHDRSDAGMPSAPATAAGATAAGATAVATAGAATADDTAAGVADETTGEAARKADATRAEAEAEVAHSPQADTSAASSSEGDPWDEPDYTASAAPAAHGGDAVEAAHAPAAESAGSAGSAEADPWDEPDTSAPAAPAAAAPAASAEADPWDEPDTTAPAGEAKPAATPAPEAAAPSADVDPWDEPDTTAPAAPAAAAPAASAEADPWDEPETSAPAAAAPAPAAFAEADPWDEPDTTAPAAEAKPAATPAPEAAAPSADVDPWDEPDSAPATPTAPAAQAEPEPATQATPAAEPAPASGTEPEPVTAPAAPAAEAPANAGDLLSAPDPWDEPDDSAPATPTAPAAEATPAVREPEPAPEPEPQPEAAPEPVSAPEPEPTPKPEPEPTQSPAAPAAGAQANAEDLLNAPDPWD